MNRTIPAAVLRGLQEQARRIDAGLLLEVSDDHCTCHFGRMRKTADDVATLTVLSPECSSGSHAQAWLDGYKAAYQVQPIKPVLPTVLVHSTGHLWHVSRRYEGGRLANVVHDDLPTFSLSTALLHAAKAVAVEGGAVLHLTIGGNVVSAR